MPSARLLVPESVADALRGEAARRLLRPGEVLADFVVACWPGYVAAELTRDLRPVLDAEGDVVGGHEAVADLAEPGSPNGPESETAP